MPNSRIDPPLTVELNEVAHIAPMPNLPGYMGDSGGFSIALHVYLQSLGQARGKWGNDEAAVMWDTAAIRVVMGGSGYVNDLEDISRLMGEVDEKTKSVSRGAGGKSTSYSKQKRRVLTVDELRTLEFGTAVIIARAARPVEARLTPYFKRKDAKEISAGQARVGKIIAAGDEANKAAEGLAPSGLLTAAAAGNADGSGSYGGSAGGGAGGYGGGSGGGGGGLYPGSGQPGVAIDGGYGGYPGSGEAYGAPGVPQGQQMAQWQANVPADPPRSWGAALPPGSPGAAEPVAQTSGPSGWGGTRAQAPAQPATPAPIPPQQEQIQGWQTSAPAFQPAQQQIQQPTYQPAAQQPSVYQPQAEQPLPQVYAPSQPPAGSYQPAPQQPAERPHGIASPQIYQPSDTAPQAQYPGYGGDSHGNAQHYTPSGTGYASAQTPPPPRQQEAPAPEQEKRAPAPKIASGWGPVRRTDQE